MVEEESKNHFNAVAPVWESKVWVNDDSFDEEILRRADVNGNEVALDIGIGTGALAKKFKVAHMMGLDMSRGMMERCPLPRHCLIEGDAHKTPFMDNTFDLVFSRNLLKHCSDMQKVLSEMYRILRPGGKLLVVESTPYTRDQCDIPTMALRVVESYHPRFFSSEELKDMVKKARFSDIDLNMFVFRKKWLEKWCEAKNASPTQRKMIFDIFKKAPDSFKKGQNVELFEDEIEIKNDFPWSVIVARK